MQHGQWIGPEALALIFLFNSLGVVARRDPPTSLPWRSSSAGPDEEEIYQSRRAETARPLFAHRRFPTNLESLY